MRRGGVAGGGYATTGGLLKLGTGMVARDSIARAGTASAVAVVS
jgi:hypothetical protein